MSSQVQFRRGTATQNNAFTGAIGELSVDTDNKTLRLHDGVTAGGGAVIMTTGATQTVLNKTFSTGSIWNGSAIPMGYGGTGSSLSATAGAVPYSTSNGMGLTLAGTSGQVLVSGGTNAPSWVSPSAITAGTAATAVTSQNIAGGSAGQLMIQADTNLTTFITAGAYGTFLQSQGAGYAPSWAAGQVTVGNTTVSLGGNVSGLQGLSNISITGNAVSNSIGTGALFVNGGASFVGNIYLSGNIVTTTTGTFTIPVGNTAQRPGAPFLGMIRYNNQISSYEGYGAGNAWSSLGGVKSVDAKSTITAEAFAGAGDDVLRFYAGDSGTSTQVMWASTANVSILQTTKSFNANTGALQVAGGVGIVGNLNVGTSSGGNVTIIAPVATNGRSAVEIIGNPNGSTMAPNTNGVMLHVTGQASLPGRVYVDGQGTGAYGAYIGRQYNGVSPDTATATLAGNVVARFGATPFSSTGWPSISTTRIDMVADENQTGTNRGSRIDFYITPKGTTESSIYKGMFLDTDGVHVAGNLYVTGNTVQLNTIIETITGSEVVAGVLTANSAAVSTSPTSGALIVKGGAGIGGNLWVGGNINLLGNVQSINITGSAGTFYGNASTGYGALYAGIPTGYTILPFTPVQVTTNYNNYSQFNQQNLSSGNQASSDFVVTADNGNDSQFYGDFGIASSTYNYTGYSSIGPNDVYLIAAGYNPTPVGQYTGNVGNVIVSSTNGMIKLLAGGIDQHDVKVTITNASVIITPNTISSSTTTGSFITAGGIGAAGDINIGGNSTITGNEKIGGNITVGPVNVLESSVSATGLSAGTQVIDSFATSAYRSAKYVISVTDNTNSIYQATEILMVQGGGNAVITTYGVINTGSTRMQFSANVVGGNAVLYGNGISASTTVKMSRTLIPV